MSGHNKASQLGQEQKAVNFEGRFLQFTTGVPANGVSGFGKGAMTIDSSNGVMYINQGSATSATWQKIQGGSYMSDVAGVAPAMYEQKARVLIVGDSIHNPNQTIGGGTPGYAPLTNWYHKHWTPNKWTGIQSLISDGSGAQFGFNSASGSAVTTQNASPGTTGIADLDPNGRFDIVMPTSFIPTMSGAPTGTTYGTATPSADRICRARASSTNTSATEDDNDGVSQTYYFGFKDPTQSGFSVGRGQVFDDGGGTASQRWYNTPTTTLTQKTIWYRGSSGWGSNLVGRATGFHGASGNVDTVMTMTGTPFHVTTQTTDTIDNDIIGTACQFDYCAANGTLTSDDWLPIFSFVENTSITDGMTLAYIGGGGFSWASHGILDSGSNTPAETPHATDGGTGWMTDRAIQQVLSTYQPNIFYYFIHNNSADDGFDEETYIQRAIQRMRDNIDAAGYGVSSTDAKFIVVTPYGIGTAATNPIWKTRADRILKLANLNNFSTIDLYTKLRDNDVVPIANGDWLHDSSHPDPHLSQFVANTIWEEITLTAT